MKKIKQIDFEKALDIVKVGGNVYVLIDRKSGVTVKKFSSLTIDVAMRNAEAFIFFIIEE